MPHNTPAPGKLEANSAEYARTQLKRACSAKLDTNVQHAVVGLFYTTTKIVVTKAVQYAATTIAAGDMILDVGINGDDNQIVNGAAISGKTNDTVTVLTIADGEVAAGKMVTASVKTASGDADQSVIVAVEYYESD